MFSRLHKASGLYLGPRAREDTGVDAGKITLGICCGVPGSLLANGVARGNCVDVANGGDE